MTTERVEFFTEGAVAPSRVPGVLRLANASRAAVVIVHDASDSDSRGAAYGETLREVGVSSLEIGVWRTPAPIGALDRPKKIFDALPAAFGAFRYLTARPEVDALRIGVMGLSWGAVPAMLTATRSVARRYLRNGERFAAHAPIHPLCWLYNRVEGYEFRDLTGAPILLQCGARDDYDLPGALEEMLAGLDAFDRDSIRTLVHPGATHDFDRLDGAIETYIDPLAHGGRGGEIRFAPDPHAARAAFDATAAFFRDILGRS